MAERICSYWKLTSNISVIEDEKHFSMIFLCMRICIRNDGLVLVGDVCIDVSSVCDSGYAWRLALYYISWNEENIICHVIMILWNYGQRGHVFLE